MAAWRDAEQTQYPRWDRLNCAALTIGPHAHIKADISAKGVVIMGAVTGNVTAAPATRCAGESGVTPACAASRRTNPANNRSYCAPEIAGRSST